MRPKSTKRLERFQPKDIILHVSIEQKIAAIKSRFGIIGEFIEFLWKEKVWWMVPMVAVLLIFALLIVFASSSPLAPFIYTLF